jgi:hypothetical protein
MGTKETHLDAVNGEPARGENQGAQGRPYNLRYRDT